MNCEIKFNTAFMCEIVKVDGKVVTAHCTSVNHPNDGIVEFEFLSSEIPEITEPEKLIGRKMKYSFTPDNYWVELLPDCEIKLKGSDE